MVPRQSLQPSGTEVLVPGALPHLAMSWIFILRSQFSFHVSFYHILGADSNVLPHGDTFPRSPGSLQLHPRCNRCDLLGQMPSPNSTLVAFCHLFLLLPHPAFLFSPHLDQFYHFCCIFSE